MIQAGLLWSNILFLRRPHIIGVFLNRLSCHGQPKLFVDLDICICGLYFPGKRKRNGPFPFIRILIIQYGPFVAKINGWESIFFLEEDLRVRPISLETYFYLWHYTNMSLDGDANHHNVINQWPLNHNFTGWKSSFILTVCSHMIHI